LRVDKFVWCVRLSKTRSIATKLCANEAVMLNNSFIKASKVVSIGDEVAIKVNPIWKRYKVIDIPKSRVGAKLVVDLIRETTPEADLEQLANIEEANRFNKSLGIKGRPTKRDRRDIDDFKWD
jgi:ribosome-associated heat shock protein Hsp15